MEARWTLARGLHGPDQYALNHARFNAPQSTPRLRRDDPGKHPYQSCTGRGACPLLSPAHHHDDLKTACKQRVKRGMGYGAKPHASLGLRISDRSAAGRTCSENTFRTWSAVLLEIAPGQLRSRVTWLTREALTRVLKAALEVMPPGEPSESRQPHGGFSWSD